MRKHNEVFRVAQRSTVVKFQDNGIIVNIEYKFKGNSAVQGRGGSRIIDEVKGVIKTFIQRGYNTSFTIYCIYELL